jgi:nucleoid-associated protein YgaU
MKTNRFLPFLMVCGFCACGGCSTLYDERREAAMREQSEFEGLRLGVRRLEERVEALAAAQQDLYREIERLQASREKSDRDVGAQLSSLEQAVQRADAVRQHLKQEIVDELSKKVATLMSSGGGGRTGSGSSGARVERGYEHVVKTGETLSVIAVAYGSTVDAIVKANGLANPDAIRVGQKLFIPE